MLPDLPPLSLEDLGSRWIVGVSLWLVLAAVGAVAALRVFFRKAR